MINSTHNLSAAFGPARHQGRRQTCLAFAASDLNGYENKVGAELSVDYLCHYAAKAAALWQSGDGFTVNEVLQAVSAPGQPLETTHPYQPSDHGAPLIAPPNQSGILYTSACVARNLTVPELLTRIRTGAAVVIIVAVTLTLRTPQSGIVAFSRSAVPDVYHALIGVGAGDHATDGEAHVLVRNSWGAGWGNNGYGWVSEQYLATHMVDSFVF